MNGPGPIPIPAPILPPPSAPAPYPAPPHPPLAFTSTTTTTFQTAISISSSQHRSPSALKDNNNEDDDVSTEQESYARGTSRRNSLAGTSDALRRVTRVSRHAALTTKQAVWDSNELSIDAALSAVDQWEAAYTGLRSLLVHTVVSARGLYGTAKDGAGKLEHGLLIPVRDWILLPAFTGAERAVSETVGFLQSPAAHHLATTALHLARGVPVVGANVLAPTLCFGVAAVQRTWDVLQYPIPSRERVRSTVDWSLNAAKWVLTAAAREVFLYAKRADANITRTLSHTQWKVLGSGPYATLDASNKRFVIDHLCERYYVSTGTEVSRYELAAHVKRHNPALYSDLVLTGLLKERGGDITEDDEWLSAAPVYREALQDEVPFLLLPANNNSDGDGENDNDNNSDRQQQQQQPTVAVSALWFRLPQVNGKQPAKDAPWICFRKQEQHALELKYRKVAREKNVATHPAAVASSTAMVDKTIESISREDNGDVQSTARSSTSPTTRAHPGVPDEADGNETLKQTNRRWRARTTTTNPPPTIAQWYTSDPATDVLVEQQRHAVTFCLSCPKCRERHPPLSNKRYGEECDTCRLLTSKQPDSNPVEQQPTAQCFALPPIAMLMRPTFWRFYGPGDEVRRATWFLDTARNGLQPFDYEAQAILEDAYLFLKWMSYRKKIDPDKLKKDEDGVESSLDESLLTVEVPGPDGTDRLVQFSSLTQATAIQKGLGAAVAIFKRRVYRGAWLETPVVPDKDIHHRPVEQAIAKDKDTHHRPVEQAIARATNDEVSWGETKMSHVSLRSILDPPSPVRLQEEGRLVLYQGDDKDTSLAVSVQRLGDVDMAKYLRDEKDGRIDHLCLIVHGIGEMMRSVDLFGLTIPNLSSVCGSMRGNHAEVQDAHIPPMYPSADVASSKASAGRVEYLPVEWHESFSILTQRRAPLSKGGDKPNVMMDDISLKTIPNMREFANDTLMDVLFFMSPEHHQIIIDVVTHEMNLGKFQRKKDSALLSLTMLTMILSFHIAVVQKFRDTTGFDGRISVIGHSLGSIICWDILSNQNIGIAEAVPPPPLHNVPSIDSIGTGFFSSASQSDQSDTPEITSVKVPDELSTSPQLDFAVDNFFLLGSPVPVFLMIRNQRKPLSLDFYLRGCRRVFNIFHPYDPVAYRLEGCIDPRNAAFEPALIRHWNGGLRVQYRTRRLWRKLVETTCKTQRTVVEAFEQSMAGAFGIGRDDDDSASEASEDRGNSSVVTGQLNKGRRIDYKLQEKEIENANEYVAALAAHSSYWIEKDLSLFIARQIYLSALEFAAAEVEAGSWETLTPEHFDM